MLEKMELSKAYDFSCVHLFKLHIYHSPFSSSDRNFKTLSPCKAKIIYFGKYRPETDKHNVHLTLFFWRPPKGMNFLRLFFSKKKFFK